MTAAMFVVMKNADEDGFNMVLYGFNQESMEI